MKAEGGSNHAATRDGRGGKSASGTDDKGGAPAAATATGTKRTPAEPSTATKQTPATKAATEPKSTTSHGQAGGGNSKCGSKQRCAEIQVHQAEESGGGTPTPANQCPTGMSSAECEALAKAIQEGGGTVTNTAGCPAAMSEAECRQLGEAYEAATK